MRRFASLVLAFGCARPSPSPRPAPPPAIVAPSPAPPPPPPPPPRSTIEAEVVTELTAPPVGRMASIAYDDPIGLTIDDAGVARQTSGFEYVAQRWIPFSEPVDDVVFVRQFAYPKSVPGAQLGNMFCARTRTAKLECVIDFEALGNAPRRVHRFALPGAGEHLGVYTPWPGQGGPDKAICTTAGCWSFDWAGTRADRYPLDAAATESAALRIAPGVRAAWQQEVPAVTATNLREVVHTERQDVAHIVGKDADITVHCARLGDGGLSCFGPGVYGELGDGTLSVTPRASRPIGDAKVIDVAADRRDVCAVTADGRVACWGELYALPLAKRARATTLPMCPLDRRASTAKYTADHTAAVQRAADCSKNCRNGGRDACLGCTVRCVPIPYLFTHQAVCQEPQIETTLIQRSETCADDNRPAGWLTDQELRDLAPEEKLMLSPAFLTGITDAVSVAVHGQGLCVVRRGGAIACLDDNGKLAPLVINP